MSVLWTSDEAVAATGGRSTTEWQATGVSIDTRTLQPGDLFVALSAARDGHDFAAQALESGAAAALVSRVPDGVAPDAPLLIVPDVLDGLADLGRAGRARAGARVVAVTGSVGKTSTKDMLQVILSGQGRTHAAVSSYNNHWGVPLTLARMPADTEYAVIEIGMNHPGEIAPLARMTRPHVALVTTVAAVHLEAFDNIEGIAREKAAIFEGLEPDGTCLFNGDLPVSILTELEGPAWATGAPVLRFGSDETCPYRLVEARVKDGTTMVRAETPDGPVMFKVASAGAHFAANALGALAAAQSAGADLALAAVDLARWSPPAGRGMRQKIVLDAVETGLSIELIDDAFNASPTSLSAALKVLASAKTEDDVGRIARGRRIAILGDMLELGPDEMALHAAMAEDPSCDAVDLFHCVGPRMAALYQALPEAKRGEWHETADQMAARAHALVDAGDVVLVKGSKGSLVSRVVDALRKLSQSDATET
ncbi:UDP-N-acetylmuramoyl-tripeptide--D-alanyl-D-alanine ligase [Actibacterium ureilyticum]|uniref:UDP-N-acetylmuramoyl-tripeptide--D-alanyl-D- alanine ligase n=1 Tax=Actibacterium ureilyticum TaxID=1590614 RepID=UPI000BAAD4A4|nr:UDP-N-acetylmuramoyl-tripeptide--D-alanyl-D-alanine ligase [Actibacterium ureilyticum]